MSPLTAVPVVPTAVPFLINTHAETDTFARCPFAKPATTTGSDLYSSDVRALLIGAIENVFGVAPVHNCPGVVTINDCTDDVLEFHTLSTANTFR